MNLFFTISIISIFNLFINFVGHPISATVQNTLIDKENVLASDDLTLKIISPKEAEISCDVLTKSSTIKVEITNLGFTNQSNFPVSFLINNNNIITETYTNMLSPGQSSIFTFSATANIVVGTTYTMEAWIALATDVNPSNDTASTTFELVNTTTVSIPYINDFENFINCSTTPNCGFTSCGLVDGFKNPTNGVADDIDWRTDVGGTPSFGTGPSTDFNPGTSTGKYLYTEASGGCNGQKAFLISPCIDLHAGSAPVLSFYYHLYGDHLGSLDVDIYDGIAWTEGIVPQVSGDQGNQWHKMTIDLAAWVGQVVNIRIRGTTGTNYESDVAIDNFMIQDFNIGDDMAVEVVGPNGVSVGCGNSRVQVALQNQGSNTQTNFNVSYQVQGGGVVTETFTGTVLGGATAFYDFTTTANLNAGKDTIRAWVSLPTDAWGYNDTTQSIFEHFVSSTVTPTWSDNFEVNVTCPTTSNCGTTACPVNNWITPTNGEVDDIDWRLNFGTTPSNATGPDSDHNPGNTIGKYLYTEASSNCIFKEAQLISPCIDLTNSSVVEFSFWYHLYGFSTGEIHVDLYDGVKWIEDIEPPLAGEQGNAWNKFSVNLAPWAGNIVNVRIRGVTGYSYASDMAIDDVNIQPITVRPEADFTSDLVSTCIGSAIQLIDDTDFPTAWNWTITPNTFQYVHGTSANSKNPEIIFTTPGNYDVQLISSNVNGSDTIMKTSYFYIEDAHAIPQSEDFYLGPSFNPTFPPQDWSLENVDDLTTWHYRNVTGQGNVSTDALYMDNYNYNAPDGTNYDRFNTLTVDLANSTQPTLSFDLAYARFSEDFHDSLRIDISTDCGLTYPHIIFKRGNLDLATVPDKDIDWIPSSPLDWQDYSLDLSSFIGESIIISFVNINGFGNNLYIDNFLVSDPLSPPTAVFSTSDPACSHEVVFTDNSINPNVYQWDFGADATPATSTLIGPHHVAYSSLGAKTVQLIVGNAFGVDTIIHQINVVELPTVGFTFNHAPNGVVQFLNQTTNANTYLWDFGDGSTSTFPNPNHKYDSVQNYVVTLEATNDCGTVIDSITLMPTSTSSINSMFSVNVFPNPTKGAFTIEIEGIKGNIGLSLLDLQGRILQTNQYENYNKTFQETIDVGKIASGIYILKIESEGIIQNVRIIKME